MIWLAALCMSIALAVPPDPSGVAELLEGKQEQTTVQDAVPEVPDPRIEDRLGRIYADSKRMIRWGV